MTKKLRSYHISIRLAKMSYCIINARVLSSLCIVLVEHMTFTSGVLNGCIKLLNRDGSSARKSYRLLYRLKHPGKTSWILHPSLNKQPWYSVYTPIEFLVVWPTRTNGKFRYIIYPDGGPPPSSRGPPVIKPNVDDNVCLSFFPFTRPRAGQVSYSALRGCSMTSGQPLT